MNQKNIFIPKRILSDFPPLYIEKFVMEEYEESETSLFKVEVTFCNPDKKRLIVSFLTDLDLLEFVSSMEDIINFQQLLEDMESKGRS
jgi:hypothetical protein